ncbi:group II intron maturase-specific domain-containing protein [Streptomyces sp. WMMB 322]|nr:group II intron maturase-specific domain-containing protein [Streptomyces sp. WMMB 322]
MLINLIRVTQGWVNYFRHAVAKHVLSKLDNLVWWRVFHHT